MTVSYPAALGADFCTVGLTRCHEIRKNKRGLWR